MRALHVRKRGWVCAALLVLAASPAARGQWARLVLDSQPGDPIGGGGHFDLIYDINVLPTPRIEAIVRRTLPTGEPAMISLALDQNGASNTYSTLAFGTDRLGIPMQPGVYLDARRAAFAPIGHPGLDVSFRNLGCNTLTGSFTVTDATFGPGNEVLSFAVTFEQHCNGIPPALFGSFTYYAVPEPGSVSLAIVGFLQVMCFRFRWRRDSGNRTKSNASS